MTELYTIWRSFQPGLKSALGTKRTWTGGQNPAGSVENDHNVISPLSIDALRKVRSITSSAMERSNSGKVRPTAFAVAQLADLSGGNRQQMNSTTDKRPDDRASYSDVLKIAAKDQFETVRHGPRVPVVHDLGD